MFTRVLLGGYALTQVRMIHILLTSVSQVHHVSIVVVVVALEWLSGVTTMSQHAHKKKEQVVMATRSAHGTERTQ